MLQQVWFQPLGIAAPQQLAWQSSASSMQCIMSCSTVHPYESDLVLSFSPMFYTLQVWSHWCLHSTQAGSLKRSASDAALLAARRPAGGSELQRTVSVEPLQRSTGRQRTSLLARESRASECKLDRETAGRQSAAAGAEGGTSAAPRQTPETAGTMAHVSPFARVAQQGSADPHAAEPWSTDNMRTATARTDSEETQTAEGGVVAPGSPFKAPPLSPCFETPAAAEVLAMQLPAAAASPAAAAVAAPTPRQRQPPAQPKAGRQRGPALPRHRPLKRAGSKGRPTAKRSQQARAPMPPLYLPQAQSLPPRQDSVTHVSGPQDDAPAAVDQCGTASAAGLSGAAWQQPADVHAWRQAQLQVLPPSLWQAMAGLHYGSAQQLSQLITTQPQLQQLPAQVPAPSLRPSPWYEAARAGLQPFAQPNQQAAQRGSPAYRPAAQQPQGAPAQQGWRPLQPQAIPWQDRAPHHRLQPPPPASTGPPGLGFWGGQPCPSADGKQGGTGAAASQPAQAWSQGPAAGHSTAISVAPQTMHMVLQQAPCAGRQAQQPGGSAAGLWQTAVIHSAAMGSGDGSWAAWQPP